MSKLIFPPEMPTGTWMDDLVEPALDLRICFRYSIKIIKFTNY